MKNKQCRTHRYSQGGHVLQILEYLVILCFEKRRPKQKCCCIPEVKHFPPKVFGLATPLAGPPMTMMTKKNWWSSTWYNCHYCISSASQDLEQQKDVNFLSFSNFLVGASLDVFFCLVPLLVWNFDSGAKSSLQQTHLIQVSTPRSVQLFIILIASISTAALW